jgi:hypothetical protein
MTGDSRYWELVVRYADCFVNGVPYQTNEVFQRVVEADREVRMCKKNSHYRGHTLTQVTCEVRTLDGAQTLFEVDNPVESTDGRK